MAGEQSTTFEFLVRGEYDAREYIMRFWDGDQTVEVNLTPFAKVTYDADKGKERGIEPNGD